MRATYIGFGSLALLVATMAWAAGCQFDSSALDARAACETDDDCDDGVCVAGSCFVADDIGDGVADTGEDLSFDVPFADVPSDSVDVLPDLLIDGDAPVCNPGLRQCVGTLSQVCSDDGTTLVTTDCATTPICDDYEFGCRCADGNCEERACRPGTRRCEDGAVQVCDQQGYGYDDVEDCEGEQICIGGSCVDPVCEPGVSFCAGETVVDCSDAGEPRIRVDCGAEDAYCAEEPEVGCEERVCPPLSYRCSDDERDVERCDNRGSGYSFLEACDDDHYCDDSRCVEMACEPGVQRCTGAQVYASCDDGGREEITEACPGGSYCSEIDGAVSCLDQVCGPGSRRCSSSSEAVEICDERGAGYTVVLPCGSEEICTAAECETMVCDPSTVSCLDDFSYAICDARGGSFELVGCGEGTYCDDDAGTATCPAQTCAPGTRFCEFPTQVRICDSRGSGYTGVEVCSETHACVDGECLRVLCTPGEIVCVSGRDYRQCDSSGTGWIDRTCAESEFCGADACQPQVCPPGEPVCGDDGHIYTCDDIGSAMTFTEACEFSCRGVSCRTNVCGDSIIATDDGEECDDGNALSCDGCEGCLSVSVGRLRAVSVTTNAEVWQPLRADITVEAWVEVTANGSIAGIGDTSGSKYVHVAVSGGRLTCAFDNGVGMLTVHSPTVVTGTGWHHVACVRFDQVGIAAFVDGVLGGIVYSPGAGTTIDIATRLWIGSDGVVSSAIARVDDVRVSNVARYTERFVPPLRIGTDANTMARYTFDDGAGTTAADSSGNARHLSISALTWAPDNCYGSGVGATCGDGARDPWEQCDDGNTDEGDGCSSSCRTGTCHPPHALGPGGHCYSFNGGDSWTDARDACRGWGGDLVTIDSVHENAWIAFMRNLGTSHWIGYNDRGGPFEEGDFRWSGPGSDYENWAGGEPNDAGGWGAEDCAIIYGADSGGNVGRWNDVDCGRTTRYICER